MPAHTPINLLKGGAGAAFSANCIALLADAGYKPEDFGDYDYVRGRVAQAKKDRAAYEAAQRAAGNPIDPNGPDPHTAMLARSQSGHLSQDALFRDQSQRGNACANHTPPGAADARGYHTSMAPCMPMQASGGRTTDPRGTIGSHHWAVSQNEAAQRNAGAGQPQSASAISQQCVANTGICTGDNPQAHDSHMSRGFKATTKKGKKGKKKVSASTRAARAADRRALHDSGRAASAAQLNAGSGASASGSEGSLDGNTAAECINAFREAAMAQMKQGVVDKYGQNFDQTQTAANNELSAATTAAGNPVHNGPLSDHATDVRNRAQQTLNDPNATPQQRAAAQAATANPFGTAQAERAAARERLARAQQEVDSLPCLNAQARSLCGMPPATPPSSFTPPNPLPPAVSQPPTGMFPP